MLQELDSLLEVYASLKEQIRKADPHLFEQWKAGGFIVDDDVLSMYPSITKCVQTIHERQQAEAAIVYRVTLADGSTHDVPGDRWQDEAMNEGDTYTPENCEWFDDILAGLRDHVPGTAEFASVEVRKAG